MPLRTVLLLAALAVACSNLAVEAPTAVHRSDPGDPGDPDEQERAGTQAVAAFPIPAPASGGSEPTVPAPAPTPTLTPAPTPTREPFGYAAEFSGVLPTVDDTGTPPDWPPRVVTPTVPAPFAQAGPVVLHHPSTMIERIGFHESSHEGAQDLAWLPDAVSPLTLDTRDRLTGPHTAADVVVAPDVPIAAPTTGIVIRAGTYTLYCEHTDGFVVIEPDASPGWEVKILHIQDLTVTSGMRVEAGVSMIAERPTILPFRSQVDDHTGEPSWPHAHIEVVDPSIPNIPSGGPAC